MKFLVTYISQTGNTKKIAEAIYETIPEEKELKPLGEVESLDDYDFVFIGFPVQQFGPIQKASKFLKTKASGRKIAIFVTHATPPGIPILEGILAKCKKAATGSELVGFFDCQGELSENVAQMLMRIDNPQMQEFGKMRHLTVGHPDASEVESARVFARDIMDKISK